MSKIDRRTLLKGLGAAAGLGQHLLTSRVALGQTTEAPTRFLLVGLQHGWGMDRGIGNGITGSEFNFTLPAPFDALAPIKDQLIMVDGVRGTLWGNAHDVSYSDMFTASVPWGEGSSSQLGSHFPEPMGPSLDHVISQHVNKPVLRVSNRYRSWGRQDHPLCFDDNARVQASFVTPETAYDAVVGPLMASANPPPPGQRAVRDNLFSFLGKDTNRLLSRVSGTERSKLEGFLQSFNELGDRIIGQPTIGISPDAIPDRPPANSSFGASFDHYLDLIRLVFQADTHRVAVLGLGQTDEDWEWTDSNGQTRYGNTFGGDMHQDVAHHGGDNNPRLCYEGWCRWYMRRIVQFVQTLAQTPDVDGRTLIDNTVIVLTGEVGTGNHGRRDKLHVLIGGGGGIRRGRWIQLEKVDARNRQGVFIGGQNRSGNLIEAGHNYGTPFSRHHTADLLLSLAHLAGVDRDSFGLAVNNYAPINLM